MEPKSTVQLNFMYSAIDLDLTSLSGLLRCWLSRYLSQEGLTWLDERVKQIATDTQPRVFLTSFSAVPRHTGRDRLKLMQEDLQAAEARRTEWFPGHWSLDQAARTLLILALVQDNDHPEKYLRSLEQIFTTATEGELVALYQSLPLLPYQEQLRARAAEGVRSNMTTVFNAIALRNPFPADYFDNIAWNQMVLKAVFVGSPLHLICGLDRRANPDLARMLTDYAHERWAAHRSVTPELWRLVGRFADAQTIAALEKVLTAPDSVQQEAAALACSECPLPQAQELLARRPDLQLSIAQDRLTWRSFSRDRLATCH